SPNGIRTRVTALKGPCPGPARRWGRPANGGGTIDRGGGFDKSGAGISSVVGRDGAGGGGGPSSARGGSDIVSGRVRSHDGPHRGRDSRGRGRLGRARVAVCGGAALVLVVRGRGARGPGLLLEVPGVRRWLDGPRGERGAGGVHDGARARGGAGRALRRARAAAARRLRGARARRSSHGGALAARVRGAHTALFEPRAGAPGLARGAERGAVAALARDRGGSHGGDGRDAAVALAWA